VLLVVMQPACAAEMIVNAVHLPPLSAGAGRWEQDITPLLRVRNELLVGVAALVGGDMVHGQQARGRLPSVIGTVALEIVAADGVTDRSVDA
jgi:hypothetical protein